MNLKSSYRLTSIAMVIPTVAFLLFMSVFPLVYSLVLSFHRWNLVSGLPPRFTWFSNFITLFMDDRFWLALKTTLLFSCGVVAMEFLIGLGLALLLVKRSRIRSFLRSAMVIPMMLTPVAVALMWRYIYNSETGILKYLFSSIGVESPVWLGEVNSALPAIMIVDIWQWTPFIFLILLAGISSLSPEIFEAARVDGATPFQIFQYITLPLIVPFILIAVLIRFMDSLKIFDIIYILTGGGPADSTQTLSLYIYKVGLKFFKVGYACALSYIMLVIIILFSQLLLRLQRE